MTGGGGVMRSDEGASRRKRGRKIKSKVVNKESGLVRRLGDRHVAQWQSWVKAAVCEDSSGGWEVCPGSPLCYS